MTATIISIVCSVISGMTLFFLQRFFKKKEDEDKKKEEARRKENILILKSIDAIGKLTYANAIAIRDGRTNGELKDALKDYHNVRDELYDYLLEQNSHS